MRERFRDAVRAAYHRPAGLPAAGLRGPKGDFRNQSPRSARGGPPIWRMKAAWMPSPCTCSTSGIVSCRRHLGQRRYRDLMERGADPDGFAVFGQFPKGFLAHVLRHRWLGEVERDEILHVCSGTLQERWTVDIRASAKPSVVADGCALPFRSEVFKAVLLDPPYSEEYARNLYRGTNPRPSWLLREAARVVRDGGRIGLLHVACPFAPPDCVFVSVYGITTGPGYRIRALTLFEKARRPMLFPQGEVDG